jgi:S-adenosyl-L-methionine hydrolase (adenosine-forming)
MTGERARRICLITDFGTRDPYVAAIKGVILGIAPEATIEDLSHEIAPQDIIEGALFLAAAAPYWPEGTVFIAVIDPGVGTQRNALAVSAGGQYFLCPDNGLLSLYLQDHPLESAYAITNHAYLAPEISPTFHGRDIFAPAAAHLLKGVPIAELGDPLDRLALLDVPEIEWLGGDQLEGEIIHIDRFGNAITNVRREDLDGRTPFRVRTPANEIGCIVNTYGEAQPGHPLALFGSAGYLEIALREGNASTTLSLQKGDAIVIDLA